MFSLIIVIIAIALVAALAAATIYYGGRAFQKSGATADAAKLVTQSQQILGAMELYRADHGSYPTRAQLTAPDSNGKIYLRSWPVAVAPTAPSNLSPVQGAVATATAAGALEWRMLDGVPLVWLQGRGQDVCSAFNQVSRGDDGIMNKLSTKYLSQCWAPPGNNYTAVVGKVVDTATLTQVAGDPLLVVEIDAPVGTPTDPLWKLAPGSKTSSGTGSGGTGGTGGTGGGSGASSPDSGASTPSAARPTAAVSQSQLTFTPVAAGTRSDTKIVTLTNNSLVDLSVAGATVSGEGFSSETLCQPVLRGGFTCATSVWFQSSNGGDFTGALRFNTNADPAVAEVALSATALKSRLALSTLQVPFGAQAAGAQVDSAALTLTNNGNTPAIDVAVGALPEGFSIVNSNCTSSLAAAQSCSFAVRFNATAQMTAPGGAVQITSRDSSVQFGVSATVGKGSVNDGATLDFGSAVVGTTAPMTVNVRNDGGSAFTVSSVTSSDAGNYQVSSSCTQALNPGDTCPVTVTFAPQSAGTLPSTLTVASTAPNSPFTLSMTGVGEAALTLAPSPTPDTYQAISSLPLGAVPVGTTRSVMVYFHPITGSKGTISEMALVGSEDFTITEVSRFYGRAGELAIKENCGATLAGASAAGCQSTNPSPGVAVQVTFNPAGSTADRTASLQLSYFNGVGQVTSSAVQLSASGSVSPKLSAASVGGSLPFESTVTDSTNATPYVVRVSSTGTQPLKFNGISLSGPYAQTNTCPAAGGTLPVGQSCDITVRFAPTVVSSTNPGTLSVATDDPAGAYSLALSGNSVSPLTLTASSAAGSVTSTTGQNLGDQLVGTSGTATYYFLSSGGLAPAAVSATLSNNSAGQNFKITRVAKVNSAGTSVSCGASGTATALSGCTADATYPNIVVDVQFSTAANYVPPGSAETADLTLSYANGTGTNATTAAVRTTAKAIAAGQLSASAAAFGQATGSTTRTVTVTNIGGLAVTGVYLDSLGSSMIAGNNSCGNSGSRVTLAPGASCSLDLSWSTATGGAPVPVAAVLKSDSGDVNIAATGTYVGSASPALLMRMDAAEYNSTTKLFSANAGGTIAGVGSGGVGLSADAANGTGSGVFAGTGGMTAAASASEFGGANFTVEMFVKYTTDGTLLTRDNNDNVNYGNLFFGLIGGGKPAAYCNPNSGNATGRVTVISSVALPVGTWTHVAWMRSGSTWNMYVGGTLAGTTTGSCTFRPGDVTRIGHGLISSSPAGYFNGGIDHLRIVKAAIYPTAGNFRPPAAPF